jgi:hypothetical protein
MNKQLLLEKYIKVAVKKALKEQEEQQKKAEKAMYMVYRFPGLKKVMEDLMSPAFGRYVNGINLVAPKPTTFKVDLINGQDFSIKYIGKGNFQVKVSGRKYDPINLGELERASQGIADLLELNYAPKEGIEGGSSGTPPESPSASSAELGPDLAAAGAAETASPAGETPPAEATPPAGEEAPTEETPPA